MKLVAWFSEVDKDDVGLVGGKGANLGELTRAGIPVPSGFILTAHAYSHFLDQSGVRSQIEQLLAGLDVNDSATLQHVAAEIKQLITSAQIPQGVAGQVARCYREMGGGPVAVRSSATAEDLAEASFAGQQSTYLNVIGEEQVTRAVQDCWASLFEARAIFYRQNAGFEHLKVGIAVVVQHMVQSERSGVMFTLEPVSGARDKIVIEAIYGLGEAVVSGVVTPDLYILNKTDLSILDRTIAQQECQLVRNPEGAAAGEYNVWLNLAPDLGAQQKLSDDDIKRLAEIGRSVEQHYGRPQDIEWAAEGGQFFLVQARPVTVTGAADDENEMEHETAPVLMEGSPAGPGVAYGPVKIVLGPEGIDQVAKGDILVAEMTTPDFVPAMKRAAAIVTDRGGRTSHAAIVSRELGLPAIVGTGNATQVLHDEQEITVSCAEGDTAFVYTGIAKIAIETLDIAAIPATRTQVMLNMGNPAAAFRWWRLPADGVGLARMEFVVS
ncbi:MAG: phosphoenolpyruvate synthase, partial [Dehalococcoidia bacterium]|nr:phosphoenolpyruvate synthase [Dehalococcoidia bacterium]